MALEKDSIKDLFSSKLGNSFEPEVPASVWGGIDQLLPKEPSVADPSSVSTNSSTVKATAIKAIAIATGIAALVTTTVLIIPSDKTEDSPKTEQTEKVEPEVKSLDEKILDEDLAEKEQVTIPKSYDQEIVVNRSDVNQEQSLNNPETISNLAYTTPKVSNEPKLIDDKLLDETASIPEIIEILPSQSISQGISIGFKGNIGVLADNYSQSGGALLFAQKDPKLQSLIIESNNEFKLHHNQPISFALTLDKRISPKFSIETGLLYTYLSSDITSSKNLIIKEEQKFHYLGIPIYLNYDIYNTNKVRFYLSLGAVIQKDIKGTYKSSMKYEYSDLEFNPYIYDSKENIHQDNLQFSGHLLLGVSYPVYKKIYLYGTVGGAYYFDAKNKYRTIYSDKETQIDVNLGLKFNF